jgi:hypothetical protein
MNITLIGKSIFSKRIGKDLSLFDQNININLFNIFSFKSIFKYLNSKVVYLISGTLSYKSGPKKFMIILLSLLLRKRVIIHWIGSDVIRALNTTNSFFNKIIITKVHHFCETKIIADELSSIQIKAEVLPYQYIDINNDIEIKLPNEFIVSIYLGDKKEKFYGKDLLLKAINDFPDIKFIIFGTNSLNINKKNVISKGWIDDVENMLLSSTVFLRLPKHDGLGHTVLHALSLGRYVIRTQNSDNVIYIKEYKELYNGLNILYKLFKKAELNLNNQGISYVKNQFCKDIIYNNLIMKIKEIYEK